MRDQPLPLERACTVIHNIKHVGGISAHVQCDHVVSLWSTAEKLSSVIHEIHNGSNIAVYNWRS